MVAATSLLVIGAALSRTGTMSTKLALEELGHKVWHGENLRDGKWSELWGNLARAEKLGNSNATKSAIDAIVDEWSFQGYTATLDMPAAVIFDDLLERYPNAKVLLTVRDEDKWAKSAVSTVFKIPPLLLRTPFRWLTPVQDILELNGWILPMRMGVQPNDIYPFGLAVTSNEGGVVDKGAVISYNTAKSMYSNYKKRVRATVPRENLLEYDVMQGWKPLCDSLGFRHPSKDKVCPSENGIPFPKANEGSGGAASRVVHALEFLAWSWHVFFCLALVLAPFLLLLGAQMLFSLATHAGSMQSCFRPRKGWVVVLMIAFPFACDYSINLLVERSASQGICLNRELVVQTIDARDIQSETATKLLQDAAAGGTPVLIDYAKDSKSSWCAAPVFSNSVIAEVHQPGHNISGAAPLEAIFGDLLLTMHFSGNYDGSVASFPSPLHFDESPLVGNRLGFGLGIYGPIGPTVLCECGSRRDVVVLTRSCSLPLFLEDGIHEDYSTGVQAIAAEKASEIIERSDRWNVRLEPGKCLVFQPMLNFHQVTGYNDKSDGQSHRLVNRKSKAKPLLPPSVHRSWIWFTAKKLLDFEPIKLSDGRQVLQKTR